MLITKLLLKIPKLFFKISTITKGPKYARFGRILARRVAQQKYNDLRLARFNKKLARAWARKYGLDPALIRSDSKLKFFLQYFREMNGNGNDPRFIKRKAGKHFEFSDGQFIVLVDMDGDSVFKPILSVSLVPRDNSLLAANIRQQLGMKPSLITKNVLDSDFNYQKTEQHHKRQDQPSVGLIQTGSGSSRTLLVSTTSVTWLIILGLYIH